jgi:hypothetical protein
MLDKVEKRGPVMAVRVLAFVRRVLNWHASRSDNFVSPIVKGMMWTKPRERARDRVLSPVEIKAIWEGSKTVEPAAFGAMVRDSSSPRAGVTSWPPRIGPKSATNTERCWRIREARPACADPVRAVLTREKTRRPENQRNRPAKSPLQRIILRTKSRVDEATGYPVQDSMGFSNSRIVALAATITPATLPRTAKL